MRQFALPLSLALALVFSAVFAASPAIADQSPKAGGKGAEKRSEKGQGKQTEEKPGVSGQKGGPVVKGSQFFHEENRIAIHKYYGEKFRSGGCPPGLAKKGNGCMPPGQAKKWMIGRPLPRDVVFYDLPPEVHVYLGPVPSGHRVVRVASDILMIAIGTGMVVDAIEDIGRY